MCLSEEQVSNPSEIVFFRSLSFDASDVFSTTDKHFAECVTREALRKCENGRWSPFICIMALASVVELPITSLFPDTEDKSAVALCNGNLFPRKKTPAKTPIYLLWSVCTMPSNGNKHTRPNHIVPVVVLKDANHAKAQQRFGQATLSFQSAKPKPIRKCSEQQQSLLKPTYQTERCASNMNSDTSEISDLDIGSVYLIADKMSDSQKYNAVKNVWKPDSEFTFPSRSFIGNKRRFMLNWLPKFPWLAYSKK